VSPGVFYGFGVIKMLVYMGALWGFIELFIPAHTLAYRKGPYFYIALDGD